MKAGLDPVPIDTHPGTLETPAGTTKYLAALQDKHKEVFEQLHLPFPKLKHLEAAAL